MEGHRHRALRGRGALHQLRGGQPPGGGVVARRPHARRQAPEEDTPPRRPRTGRHPERSAASRVEPPRSAAGLCCAPIATTGTTITHTPRGPNMLCMYYRRYRTSSSGYTQVGRGAQVATFGGLGTLADVGGSPTADPTGIERAGWHSCCPEASAASSGETGDSILCRSSIQLRQGLTCTLQLCTYLSTSFQKGWCDGSDGC